MKTPMKSYMSKYLSEGPGNKSIHGVKTGNHSNPHVLKAGGMCRASGGKVEGGMAKMRLDRPNRKMTGKAIGPNPVKELTGNPTSDMPKATERVKQGMPKRDGSDKYASGGAVPTNRGEGRGGWTTGDATKRADGKDFKKGGSVCRADGGKVDKKSSDPVPEYLRGKAKDARRDVGNAALGAAGTGALMVSPGIGKIARGLLGTSSALGGANILGGLAKARRMDESADKWEKTGLPGKPERASGGSVMQRDWKKGDATERPSGEKFAKGGKAGNWIAGATQNKGALHKALGVPKGEKIPEKKLEKAEHSDNPKMRKRAMLAETLKGFHKK